MAARAHSPLRPGGFTLIELMVVVAIIGLVASVAIPVFSQMTLRTKTTERVFIMNRIKQAIMDYQLRVDSRPTWMMGNFNPPLPATSQKRALDLSQPDWNLILDPNDVEGAVYYSYQWWVWEFGGQSTLFIWARGDLDGDGNPSDKQVWYQRIDGIYKCPWDPALCEWPAPGFEDQWGF
ncbi:MAG TPA: type II secretion system protein [Anaeromyxobacteraceae bacterium]